MSSKTRMKRRASRQRSTLSGNHALLIGLGGVVLIGAAALLIFSSGSGAASAPPATPEVTGRPALKANQELVDLGDVRLGKWVNVAFELTNVGDLPLIFMKKPYVEVVEGC